MNLVYYQWGAADFLDNQDLTLPNVTTLDTVYSKPSEYVFSGIFNDAPEFGYYIKQTYPSEEQDELKLTY